MTPDGVAPAVAPLVTPDGVAAGVAATPDGVATPVTPEVVAPPVTPEVVAPPREAPVFRRSASELTGNSFPASGSVQSGYRVPPSVRCRRGPNQRFCVVQ